MWKSWYPPSMSDSSEAEWNCEAVCHGNCPWRSAVALIRSVGPSVPLSVPEAGPPLSLDPGPRQSRACTCGSVHAHLRLSYLLQLLFVSAAVWHLLFSQLQSPPPRDGNDTGNTELSLTRLPPHVIQRVFALAPPDHRWARLPLPKPLQDYWLLVFIFISVVRVKRQKDDALEFAHRVPLSG